MWLLGIKLLTLEPAPFNKLLSIIFFSEVFTILKKVPVGYSGHMFCNFSTQDAKARVLLQVHGAPGIQSKNEKIKKQSGMVSTYL